MNAKSASSAAPRLLRGLETLNWRRGDGALSSRTVPSILIQSAVKQFFPGAKKYARAWRSCKFSGASALVLIHFPRERRPRAGNNNSAEYNKPAAVDFSLSHAANFDSQSGSYPSSSFALYFLFFFLISSRARLLFREEESERNWARRVKVFIQPASETDLPILWTESERECVGEGGESYPCSHSRKSAATRTCNNLAPGGSPGETHTSVQSYPGENSFCARERETGRGNCVTGKKRSRKRVRERERKRKWFCGSEIWSASVQFLLCAYIGALGIAGL